MKSVRIFFVVIAILSLLSPGFTVSASPPEVTRFTLSNGIRVISLYVEDAEAVAIFSYLPLGLATDGKAKTQWSHLLEHLILRTTGPINSKISNAETMASCMHLDFYGTTDTWKRGIELHAKWLSGLPFSAESLAEEVPRALAELIPTEVRLATHKWAFAGWNQAFRHGETDVEMRVIQNAELSELLEYRDLYMMQSHRMLLCVISRVKAEILQPAMEEQLGHIIANANTLPTATTYPLGKDLRATWDVNVIHYMETYAMPKPEHKDYAALYVANLLLNQAFMMDAELKQSIGFIISNVDLITPEQTYLYVSASLKPDADIEKVKHHIAKPLNQLKKLKEANPQVAMLAKGISRQISTPPDITRVRRYKPATRAMMLGNIGLQWGLLEFQYGDTLQKLANALSKVASADVIDVANRYLSEEQRMTLILAPHEQD